MAKKKYDNTDGVLMEKLLTIVESVIIPKPVRKAAQKIIDKLNKK